jgi:hypothetical protein
MALTKRSY